MSDERRNPTDWFLRLRRDELGADEAVSWPPIGDNLADLVVPLTGSGLSPELIGAIDRLSSDPDEEARIDQELDEIEAIDAAHRAGCEARAAGDDETAARELRRAAEGGHPEAAYELATMLLNDVLTPPTGPERVREGLQWLLEAVNAGVVTPEDLDDDLQGWWECAPDLITRITEMLEVETSPRTDSPTGPPDATAEMGRGLVWTPTTAELVSSSSIGLMPAVSGGVRQNGAVPTPTCRDVIEGVIEGHQPHDREVAYLFVRLLLAELHPDESAGREDELANLRRRPTARQRFIRRFRRDVAPVVRKAPRMGTRSIFGYYLRTGGWQDARASGGITPARADDLDLPPGCHWADPCLAPPADGGRSEEPVVAEYRVGLFSSRNRCILVVMVTPKASDASPRHLVSVDRGWTVVGADRVALKAWRDVDPQSVRTGEEEGSLWSPSDVSQG